MEEKRGKGRPSVTEKIAGSNASLYEEVITRGKQYRSRRSIADTAYTVIAGLLVSGRTVRLGRICGIRQTKIVKNIIDICFTNVIY